MAGRRRVRKGGRQGGEAHLRGAGQQRMVGHHPYGVADGSGAPGQDGAFVAPKTVLDLDSLGKRVHPRLVELVVAADPSGDELDLDVVRSQVAQPDERADMDLRTDLDRIRIE